MPCSSSGRIQERGCRKWWVQALWRGDGGRVEGSEEMGPVCDVGVGLGGMGRCVTRYGVVASVRLKK
jgi:hypothetical protein